MGMHIGRSWADQHLEISCPCPKAPCGLVNMEWRNAPEGIYCEQHDPAEARTMRQIHDDAHCPAVDHAISEAAADWWLNCAKEQALDTSKTLR
jgi:hypothetical protein